MNATDTKSSTSSERPTLDLNSNGVEDLREPWLYRLGLGVLIREQRKRPHTLLGKLVNFLGL